MKTRPPALVQLLERPASERKIGQFWLVEERGEGGYAPVWLAREMYGRTELRLSAVKLFALDEFGANKDDIVEEARALGRVDHPHVARFFGLVIEEDIGVMGLAMELLAGRSLEARLSAETRLGVDVSLSIGIAVASALAAVHQAGIIHRDVKPGNIVEDARGVYKLIDFGIASDSEDSLDKAMAVHFSATNLHSNSDEATAPVSGMVTGTLGYVDPACAGKRMAPTPARDLYALGATLYRCLSGFLPAQMEKNSDGLMLWDPLVLSGKTSPRPLTSRCPDIPPSLAALVDRLVSPRPEHRPRGALHVEYELERIRQERGGRERCLPPEEIGPFRGLRRFEAQDRDVFWGRREEMIKAMELLRGTGLAALVGPSGSGKSSLARAALIPALADGNLAKWPETWDVAIVEPGRDPWAAIISALTPFIPEAPLLDVDSLVAAMADRANDEERGIVLFVDQLEALVTTASPDSRDEAALFLAEIGERAISGVRAIVAARSDLLESLLGLRQFGRVLSRSLCIINPLRAIHWRESITGALDAYGYELENQSLENELFRGIDRVVDAMPLVEFALAEMWNERDREKRRLTQAAFDKIGGIEGALELHAEATVNKLEESNPGIMALVRSILLALTTPEGTRRARNEEEMVRKMGERAHWVLAALIEARLLVPTENGITLAHEALLVHWSRLRAWITEARADRIVLDELERDASRWNADEESVERWTGRRLALARELVRKDETGLSENVHRFIRASIRASRRRYAGVMGMAAVLVFGLLTAGIMYVDAQREFRNSIDQIARAHAEKGSLLEKMLLDALEGKYRDRLITQKTPSSNSPVVGSAAPSGSTHSTKTSFAATVANTPPSTLGASSKTESGHGVFAVGSSIGAAPGSSVNERVPSIDIGPPSVRPAGNDAMKP